MTTFLLVRHGLTDAVGRYVAGTSDAAPLNQAGLAQAAGLAAVLASMPLDAVIASPSLRTRQTAAAIARGRGIDVRIEPRIGEFDFGDWTGATFEALHGQPRWARFNQTRSLIAPPGGELMLQVQQRAVSALLDAAAAHPDRRLAVVSHADVIRAMLMHFLGMPLDLVHRIDIAPASISVVTLDANGPVVLRVNAGTDGIDG